MHALILAAVVVVAPQQGIDEAALPRAAESVVAEAADTSSTATAEAPPRWREALHHGCVASMLVLSSVDRRTTDIALSLGAEEANPILRPLGRSGIRWAKIGIAVGVAALLELAFLRADAPVARHVATGACGVAVGVLAFASGNNLRVIRDLSGGE